MKTGDLVEVVGDRYGHNNSLDVDENIGKRGVVTDAQVPGYWWVKVSENEQILAAETELKEITT